MPLGLLALRVGLGGSLLSMYVCKGCLEKGGHDGPFPFSSHSSFSFSCPAGAWRVTWTNFEYAQICV